MSKDKYLSTFLPQIEAIVFVILQIFFAKRTVLKIGEYSWIFPSRSRNTRRPIAHKRKDLMDYNYHYSCSSSELEMCLKGNSGYM